MTLELVEPEPDDYNPWTELFDEYGADFKKAPAAEINRAILGCIEVDIDPMAALSLAKRAHERKLDDAVPEPSVRGSVSALESLGNNPRAPAIVALNKRLLASLAATADVITLLSDVSQLSHDYVTADPSRTRDPSEIDDLLDERRYIMERIVAQRDELVTKLRTLLDSL